MPRAPRSTGSESGTLLSAEPMLKQGDGPPYPRPDGRMAI